jgi:hypothetical protein
MFTCLPLPSRCCNVNYALRRQRTVHRITLRNANSQTSARFGIPSGRIARCDEVQSSACPTIDTAELGVTDAHRVGQHGRKYWLQITR